MAVGRAPPGGPGLNRDVLADSINFDIPLEACEGNVQFRATVTQPGPPGWVGPGGPRERQRERIVHAQVARRCSCRSSISDPSSASPAPTIADFFACLTGPAEAHLFAENGFIINPALGLHPRQAPRS